jgi:hypothetical protein
MPTLVLDKLWINLMADGTGVAGASNRDKTWSVEVEASVRTYANGRRRAVTAVGVRRDIPYTLMIASQATYELLETWLGRSVMVRDNRGQKWIGIFAGLGVREYMRTDLYAVSFTLQGVTAAEGI